MTIEFKKGNLPLPQDFTLQELCDAYYKLGVKKERLIFAGVLGALFLTRLAYGEYRRKKRNGGT